MARVLEKWCGGSVMADWGYQRRGGKSQQHIRGMKFPTGEVSSMLWYGIWPLEDLSSFNYRLLLVFYRLFIVFLLHFGHHARYWGSNSKQERTVFGQRIYKDRQANGTHKWDIYDVGTVCSRPKEQLT